MLRASPCGPGGEGRRGVEARSVVMSLERWIRLIAGTFVTLSVVLSYVHSSYWLLFTLFVGLNLFQSSLTRWCLMEKLLERLGRRQRGGSDARMTAGRLL